MMDHEHERAVELITRSGVEDIAAAEAAWLEGHLAGCAECAEYAAACEGVGELLRSVAVTASPALVNNTQVRLRARALQLQERQSRNVLIAVSICIGAMSSTVSAWLWWKFGAWVALKLALPASVIEPGMFVASMVPALVIAVVMIASSRPVIDRSLTMALLGEEREGGRR